MVTCGNAIRNDEFPGDFTPAGRPVREESKPGEISDSSAETCLLHNELTRYGG